jgi:hypothetical protein
MLQYQPRRDLFITLAVINCSSELLTGITAISQILYEPHNMKLIRTTVFDRWTSRWQVPHVRNFLLKSSTVERLTNNILNVQHAPLMSGAPLSLIRVPQKLRNPRLNIFIIHKVKLFRFAMQAPRWREDSAC